MQRKKLTRRNLAKIEHYLHERFPEGHDPWGLKVEKVVSNLKMVYPIYQKYFKVRMFGAEHVKADQYLTISNHTGQIPIDGMLISIAFLTQLNHPIILRSMVERMAAKLPFIGEFFFQSGAVLGDRKNCLNLLERGESVLVFPEGVKGPVKSTPDYYKTKVFSRGFFRMALATGVTILPTAVIGAEECYPYVWQMEKLAKLLHLPSLPITPTFPWLGPLGFLPLPSPIDIHVGKPYPIPKGLGPEAPDREIDEHIFFLERQIKELIVQGLKKRRPFWANKNKRSLIRRLKKSEIHP